jgi:CO/xanthine dehydrogenase FAD-binding subunit
VRFPIWKDARIGVGFHEVSARRSDFAFVSAAAQVSLDEAGTCRRAVVGVGAVTEVPIRLGTVEKVMVEKKPDPAQWRPVIEDALAGVDITSDLHASASYRRRVAVTLALRAIADACAQAEQRGAHAR